MRQLWDYVKYFPRLSSARRRIPAGVREGLLWWKKLLPTVNGVMFFDERSRESVQLYTDACPTGLGGFFYSHEGFWTVNVLRIPQENTFFSVIEGRDQSHINVHEVEAVLSAFQQWSHVWHHKRVIVYTDNTTTFAGLAKQTLNSEANGPLRETMLIAARYDILIDARWIESEQNGLADGLSRRNFKQIANLCPHWQDPWKLRLLPHPLWKK